MESPSPTSSTPGLSSSPRTIAGRYALLRRLGSGSAGTVYLAWDPVRKSQVALKVIRSERVTSKAVSAMQREFRAIASIHHPRIAAAHDFGYTEGGLPYYTREYVQGVPLPPGPPQGQGPREHLKPILDLLEALGWLHENGILHLDVHAGNLILADDPARGGVLIDFGFVRSPGDLPYTLPAANWPGLPPEIIKGTAASPRTDVFLAGGLLHYRLTGQVGGEVRLPREIPGWGARLTLDLERITSKALQPVPERRFGSVGDFREALARALGDPVVARAPAAPREVTLGREREIEAIEERLRAAAAGEPALLGFAGGPGWGKSRLLEEARIRAQLRGLEVVHVHGLAEPERGPALADALRRAPGGAPWLEPVAARHGGTPAERARLAAEAYFFEEEKPLVVLVDDMEALDKESRLLADALLAVATERREGHLCGRGLGMFVTAEDAPALRLGRRDLIKLTALRDAAARRLFRELAGRVEMSHALTEDAVLRSGGVPLRLRRIAAAVREEWGRKGAVPDRIDLLETGILSSSIRTAEWRRIPSPDRRVVEVLAAIRRPARVEELAAALGLPFPEVAHSLRRLRAAEVVQAHGKGKKARFRLHPAFSGENVDRAREGSRRMHAALARHLRARLGSDPMDHEHLARHLLAAGRRAAGCAAALRAAKLLEKRGLLERAFQVLEAALAGQPPAAFRLPLAEESSALAEATGDHPAGIRVLEPIYRRGLEALEPREATRLRRCLGIHYHRSGLPEKALEVFEEAERAADPARDVEDLVFIDSELAEIHTFRGAYGAAEAACRRGLGRLATFQGRGGFRARMELTLRASLGHLQMRRMDLVRARGELEAALKASRRHGTTADRAAILNNLGIAASQQNDFRSALGRFNEARRLLARAGERQGTIRVAANLAVLHAKLGERDEAMKDLDRAARLRHYYPSKQLEFFVEYARGTVHSLFGDAKTAIEAFERALPLGRDLGDRHLVSYGEVYLAEARMASGEYREASRLLRAAGARARTSGEALLARMVHSRACFLETLLGRPRAAAAAREVIAGIPRTGIDLLEAWNDLHAGMADVLSGRGGAAALEAALCIFERVGVPAGARFARLGQLTAAIASGDQHAIRRSLASVAREAPRGHQLLDVAESLARAEAHFALGEVEAAIPFLDQASGAIVGMPFLELDWRIELLRARIRLHAGDVGDARRHLHRSLHTRDLLLQLLPREVRRRFAGLPRFAGLAEMEKRLRRSPRLAHDTEAIRRSSSYEGIVGVSTPMTRVFGMIERIAGEELPVLITGETGTGKELVARAIHRRSLRAGRPFLAVHSASLLGEIFESELFGAVAGAYTGAEKDRPGILETLARGTLLLDEVGQLGPEAQAKLLRVIESGAYRSLGSVETRRADVRFLASASEDLRAAAAAGRFRADLYYRLCAVEIALPPLRSRREDIWPLALHLLEKHSQRLRVRSPAVADEARALLERHRWPGNVRELEGVLVRALVTASDAGLLTARALEPHLGEPEERVVEDDLIDRKGLSDLKLALERQYLIRVFRKCGGDPGRMMRRLGVKRTRLYTWYRRLGIDVKELRKGL